MKRFSVWLAMAISLAAALFAFAHDFKIGAIRIIHPYAVSSLPGVPNGMAFFDINNTGSKPDKLLKVSSSVSERVEIHQMKMEADVMKMREVAAIELMPEKTLKMADLGFHVMFIGLKQPLQKGDKFPATLSFANAGDVKIELWVQDREQGAKAMNEHHSH